MSVDHSSPGKDENASKCHRGALNNKLESFRLFIDVKLLFTNHLYVFSHSWVIAGVKK